MPRYLDEGAIARALVQDCVLEVSTFLTPLETGMMGKSDHDQLQFAVSRTRGLYTFNVGDFCRLHTEYLEAEKIHAGIVVVPRQ